MSREKPRMVQSAADEIAALAAGLVDDIDGLDAIDREIHRANADSRWDDLGKWHRVRLRCLRMRRQRALSEGSGSWLYQAVH